MDEWQKYGHFFGILFAERKILIKLNKEGNKNEEKNWPDGSNHILRHLF